MKKLGLIFVVFLCFSLFLVPNKSFAQPSPCPEGQTQSTAGCVDIATAGQNDVETNQSTAEVAGSDAEIFASAKPLGTSAPGGVEETGECSLRNLTACITEGVGWMIRSVFLNIAGFFLWVSANMLNYAIQVGILDFSKWAPDALYPIWIVVRQIVSLFVVFAGLWLGLMYIIGKDETFEKYIPWVVIFALFVNFSYPLVRTAVDISNVVSLNIYASAVGNEALTGTGNNTAGSLIMSRLGLSGLILSATTADKKANTTTLESSMVTKINSMPGSLMAIVFVLYAAYIFFMVTALIIMRTVSLVFLIIASPILFIDSVIPKLGDEAVKLRKIFFEQLAVGPVFMIMLALTIKFLGIFGGVATSGGRGTHPTVVEFFNIAMMLIMLHIMLKITKSTSGSIGQMATNAMGKVGGFAGGMAMGGVGMLGRAGIGRVAAKVRDSSWMTNQTGKDGVGGFVGRHAYSMSNSVANASFDARNSSYVQAGATKLGMGVGMGSTMSYEKSKNENKRKIDARVQDRKERYNNIKTTNEDDSTNYVGAKSRQEFFDGGNDKDKVAMFKSDKEEAEKENREKNAEIALKADTYKALGGDNKKEYFANQTSSTQTKLVDNDRELAEKMNKERNEKQEERDRAAAAIDASNKARQEQTKAMVDAMKSQQAGTQTQPPAGYTPPKEVAMTSAAEKMKNNSTPASQSDTHDINTPLEFA